MPEQHDTIKDQERQIAILESELDQAIRCCEDCWSYEASMIEACLQLLQYFSEHSLHDGGAIENFSQKMSILIPEWLHPHPSTEPQADTNQSTKG